MMPHVLITITGIYALLLLATIIIYKRRKSQPGKGSDELVQRINSWWVMITLLVVPLMLHKNAALVFFAFLSFIALKEFLSLVPTRRTDRRVLFWAYLTIPLQFYWIAIGWYTMFIVFVPVYVFLLLPLRMVIVGDTRGFLTAAGTLHWGVMINVFAVSHIAYLLVLSEEVNPQGGAAGLVLCLVLLTELNDVAQFCWGKALGKRKIVPRVSPNKTLGGLLGGLLTTILAALVIAPWLTPLDWDLSLWVGLMIGLAGFVGDVVISAVKRDLQVKDSGHLIPGHGGILDRIDSLTYTAPLFFHFIHYFCY